MAYKISFAREAVADLEHIYQYIQAEHSSNAANWYRGLEAAILTLQQLPQRCPITPERPDLRHLLYGNKPHIYRILFAISESEFTVNIAQIRHGARKPTA